jgi:dienelactone hydrolase
MFKLEKTEPYGTKNFKMRILKKVCVPSVNKRFATLMVVFTILFCGGIELVWADTIILNLEERKHGKSLVPVKILFPSKPIKKPIPLIILQHGSTRDAGRVFNSIVETDEHQKQLANAALDSGFAVALIDAFYKKQLKSNQKTLFPVAQEYARQIAGHFVLDNRLDPTNFFYHGFSYGGNSALLLMGDLKINNNYRWAGIVAAEPPCNVFHEARKFISPLLTIKGGESHYEPLPCETMTRMYKKAGADAEIITLPKSNHFFSHNGEIVKGLAFNGCGNNPVILKKSKNAIFFDGSIASRSIVREKCFTKQGGSGKSREDLAHVINLSIQFFIAKLN